MRTTLGKVGVLPTLVCVAVGVIGVTQGRINGQLGTNVTSGLFPAWLSTVTGLVIMAMIVTVHRPTRAGVRSIGQQVRGGAIPWIVLSGGVLGAIGLVMQSVAIPLVGVAVFTVGVVAGLTGGSLAADRVNLGGLGARPVTWSRVLAAGVAILAVLVGVSDRLGSANSTILLAGLAVLTGAIAAPQQAFGGRLAVASRSPLAATLVNSIGGVLLLTTAMIVSSRTDHLNLREPLGSPWWTYVGGALGILFVAGSAWSVPKVGVFLFALLLFVGQAFGALLLDLVFPTPGTTVGWHLFVALALTCLAVFLAAPREP